MSDKHSQHTSDALQRERERRAYLRNLTYNDALERMAANCNDCGNTDPWFPRCERHEPI